METKFHQLEEPLTLHLQVKGHFLCVIPIGYKDGVEAFLFCPHPHQGENADVPEGGSFDVFCSQPVSGNEFLLRPRQWEQTFSWLEQQLGPSLSATPDM